MLTLQDFEGYEIPTYMRGGLVCYVNSGILPGSFLAAILANEQELAGNYADSENCALIPEYLRFMREKVPQVAWGSSGAVSAWCASFRTLVNSARSADRPADNSPSFSSSFAWPFPTAPAPVESTPEREPVFSSGGGDFGGGGASSSWSDSFSSSSDSSSSSSSDSGSCSSSSSD